MDFQVEMIQRNQRKKPCNCACYVRIRETLPFCDNPQSPYYLRCPAGTCDQKDDRDREELLEQRAREQRENVRYELVTTQKELNDLRKQEAGSQ